MKDYQKFFPLIIALVAAFLFTESGIGINAAIFSALSAVFIRYRYREISNSRFLFIIAPNLLTALFIMLFPQLLSKVFWFISYGIMWTAAAVDLRPILLFWQAIISIFQSPFKTIAPSSKAVSAAPSSADCQSTDSGEAKPATEAQNQKGIPKFLAYILALFIIGLFSMLYISANPVIQNYLIDIRFDWLNMRMLYNSFWYLLLFYGLVILYPNKALQKRNKTPLKLNADEYAPEAQGEYLAGKVSLWALSGILLLMNGMDLFILISGRLPEGMSYSEFVHQGFYTLIFSIVLAILLILFFFRGALNFHETVEKLRLASRVWLYQNLLLVIITCSKLFMYIGAYGLTYLRITVFLCLLCVLVGLLLSFRKIKQQYRNWLFFNQMALYAYGFTFVIALIPYDTIISRYNLSQIDDPDIYYLLRLDRPDLEAISKYSSQIPLDSMVHQRLKNREEAMAYQAEVCDWREWNLYTENQKKE